MWTDGQNGALTGLRRRPGHGTGGPVKEGVEEGSWRTRTCRNGTRRGVQYVGKEEVVWSRRTGRRGFR